jgi:hypothetical protein
MLERKLGHPLADATDKEIADLRTIYASIRDGNSTWQEYVEEAPEQRKDRATIDLSDVKPGKEENRGHGNENLNQPTAATDTLTICGPDDWRDIETAASDAKIKSKALQEHIVFTMGCNPSTTLPVARKGEVIAWINAHKK